MGLLIEQADETYSDTCITIEVHFNRKIKSIIEEYFPDSEMDELSGEMSRVWIRVPPGNGYGGLYYLASETRLK